MLEDPSDRTVVALETASVDKRRNPWKALLGLCPLVACDALKEGDLQMEAESFLRARGVKASRDVVRRIVEMAGADLARLLSELEKLTLAAEGDRIEGTDAESLLWRSRERAIWDLTDALAARDRSRAMHVLDEMLEDGANEHYLVAMAEWSFRNLLAGADLVERGRNPRQAAQILNVRGPGVERFQSALRRYDRSSLRTIIHRMAALDRNLKSSRVPARLHLERFVIEACGRS
jgi:DNA polymerase-3 subunit delta